MVVLMLDSADCRALRPEALYWKLNMFFGECRFTSELHPGQGRRSEYISLMLSSDLFAYFARSFSSE